MEGIFSSYQVIMFQAVHVTCHFIGYILYSKISTDTNKRCFIYTNLHLSKRGSCIDQTKEKIPSALQLSLPRDRGTIKSLE